VEWAATNTKQCPACETKVEKNGGCDTITCRCGTSFCYNCGLESAACRERGCKASAVPLGDAPAGEAAPAAEDNAMGAHSPAALEPRASMAETEDVLDAEVDMAGGDAAPAASTV